jgi:hypothetical protein
MFEHVYSAEESAAFNEGFEAAFNGADEFFDNPYHGDEFNPDLVASWNDGYHDFFKQEEERDRREFSRRHIDPQDPVLLRLVGLPIEEIGAAIGMEVSAWPGRCFEVASKIVDAFQWADAQAVYGLYLGPVSKRCTTFTPAAQSTVRHGWIVTREGVLVDPTAWVFAAQAPALRVLVPGTDEALDHRDEYDEGAEALCGAFRGPFPPPKGEILVVADEDLLRSLKTLAVHLSPGVSIAQALLALHATQDAAQRDAADGASPQQGFTKEQLAWLSRTPYTRLGVDLAARFYTFLKAQGLQAVIPVDFLRRSERETQWGVLPD